ADLSRLRLLSWVPETAAPVVRELMMQQDKRLRAAKLVLPLNGALTGGIPWGVIGGLLLAKVDRVPSGFDPEFSLLAYPQETFFARIFYLSTVANSDTHMFEFKGEVE